MKKMTFIPLFIGLFLLFSFSEKEPIVLYSFDVEKNIFFQEENTNYLSAQQMFYAATLDKIDRLKKEMAELMEQKESGKKYVIRDIEKNQKETEKYEIALKYFYTMKPPKGPKGRPIGPLPPVPCHMKKANCDPKIVDIKEIVIGDNKLKINKFIIVNAKEVVVGTGKMVEGKLGSTIDLKVEKFKGSGNIQTVITIGEIGELAYEIPCRGY